MEFLKRDLNKLKNFIDFRTIQEESNRLSDIIGLFNYYNIFNI